MKKTEQGGGLPSYGMLEARIILLNVENLRLARELEEARGRRPSGQGMPLQAELSEAQAWALAEFFKRAGWSDYRALAADEREAYDMRDAGEKVRAALAEFGYAPR